MLDTYDLYELDLVAIGANSAIGEDAVITAAFVAPPGFADEGGLRLACMGAYLSSCIPPPIPVLHFIQLVPLLFHY